MEIHTNGQIDPTHWDNFVSTFNESTPHQLWGWKKVYEKTFSLKAYYLAASSNGKISGVLPLLYVKSPIYGNYLTSMPGGIIAESQDISNKLLDYGIDLAHQLNVQYLALRDSYNKLESPNLQTIEDQCTFRLDLLQGRKKTRSDFSASTRKLIRRAQREEVFSEVNNQLLDVYYPIYSQAMRERGTPTQGLSFFKNAFRAFPEKFLLFVIYQENKILGGGFVFDFHHTLVCTWSGLAKEYYPLYTSYLLFNDVIEKGFDLENQWVELGRSKWDSGAYQFKMKWGPKPIPLYQQYYLPKKSSQPATGNSKKSKSLYRAFTTVWQYLPLPITEIIGPHLRKQIPFG